MESDVTILGMDLKVTRNGTSTQSDFTEKGFKKTGNLNTMGCYRCLDLLQLRNKPTCPPQREIKTEPDTLTIPRY